jgi:hypothetical protein
MTEALITHAGGCHCGRVRFEVQAPARLAVTECNCSICSRTGYRHLIVPAARFRLLSGKDALTEYQFNTGTARHLFCSVCGIKSFYVPRSHPDGYSVNARCLDEGTVESMDISQTNGREWEKQYPAGRGEFTSGPSRFRRFADFYPFYLSEHRDPVSRRLHFLGTACFFALAAYSLVGRRYWLLLLSPLPGYALAWIGHFFFEKNRPATFSYPFYSLLGDFVMFRDVLIGRVRW